MIPIKANQYEVTLEVQLVNQPEDSWVTRYEFESAYTAADAITQVELRSKFKDEYVKAIVVDVKPRNR